MKSLLLCAISLSCGSLIGAALAKAQDFVEPRGIVVHVRTVMGYGTGAKAERSARAHVTVDKQIEDLRSKLETLHYSRYRLVSSDSKIILVKRKETMLLIGGQTLTLRPIYMDRQRMGMSLKWVGKQGAQLLDTRMHFNWGEDMLAGTESGEDSGVILAINVKPSQEE